VKFRSRPLESGREKAINARLWAFYHAPRSHWFRGFFMPIDNDKRFMQMSLELARRGLGRTWPNPMVGAVVVKNHKVVGMGWHRRYGGPHAEVFALRQAGKQAKGGTLYLNLEPCSHFGKTPPCAQALIRAGISKVVCSMQDPNPKVSGRGFRQLRKAGVRVEVGLMRLEARQLNAVFIKRIITGLPFVVNKAALSADGKIACASGASRWISSLSARRYTHGLRALADATIVGMGTVCSDNPRLTPRLSKKIPGKKLLRVVLAGKRPMPTHAILLKPVSSCQTVIASAQPLNISKLPKAIKIMHFPGRNGRVDLKGLLQWLGREGVNYVLVEGGAETHADFLGCRRPGDKILSDQIQFIYAPKIIGGNASPGPVGGVGVSDPRNALILKDCQWRALGPDMLLIAKPNKNRGDQGSGGA
jgi:diaminohydroxyphosphoribosylaminopyrimidine deaminase / 5-amino-6-(5-phosphoribosylamino)uracil reductase